MILKLSPVFDDVTLIVPVETVHVGCVTLTVGAAGTALGAAALLPAALLQPFTVVVTEYVPAVTTVMELVVAPLLHNNEPPAVVDSTELPQLFTTVTTGVAGVVPGAATPVPAALVHPFTVVVTVYVPAELTVMDFVFAPVFHNKVPEAVVESTEVPLQLFVTVTTGVAGTALGAAMPLPALLVQPFNVLVTVYVPAVVTVIEFVVSPVLHSSEPVAVVESTDDPQLFTTVTVGVAGVV